MPLDDRDTQRLDQALHASRPVRPFERRNQQLIEQVPGGSILSRNGKLFLDCCCQGSETL